MSTSAPARDVGRGVPLRWVSGTEIVIVDRDKSFTVSIDGMDQTQVYDDSTWAIPLSNGDIFFYDLHEGMQGFWIAERHPTVKGNYRKPRLLLKGIRTWDISLSTSEKYFLIQDGGETKRVYLSNGRQEPLKYQLPTPSLFKLSHDEKEIIFGRRETRGRLVAIDNLLR